jgi:hypothetical protein
MGDLVKHFFFLCVCFFSLPFWKGRRILLRNREGLKPVCVPVGLALSLRSIVGRGYASNWVEAQTKQHASPQHGFFYYVIVPYFGIEKEIQHATSHCA